MGVCLEAWAQQLEELAGTAVKRGFWPGSV